MDPLACTSPWFAFARDQAKARPFADLWSLAEQLRHRCVSGRVGARASLLVRGNAASPFATHACARCTRSLRLSSCCRVSADVAAVVSRCQLRHGMTSGFDRRVWAKQRPHDYAMQSGLQNQQITQLRIVIGGCRAAQLCITIHPALHP